jgi:hypothetical protein
MNAITIEQPIHFDRRGKGARKVLRRGSDQVTEPIGRMPRIARLMALALRLDALIRDGTVRDAAEIARLGHVSRARVSQILNLLYLAPDIQEALLFLPPVRQGRDPIILADLQPIALTADWRKQRLKWSRLPHHSVYPVR